MFIFGKKESTLAEIKDLYVKGNYARALKSCISYIDKNKDDFDASNLLGDIYYKLGEKNKCIENYLGIVDKLEKEKFFEKTAAVLRKLIRFYPDQFDIYRKLASVFQKKGVIADQLRILNELKGVYYKVGNIDKAIDILKEIAEIDRSNIDIFNELILKLNQMKMKQDVCKYIPYAISLAKDESSIGKFIDIAVDCKCDLSTSVKYIGNVIKQRKDVVPGLIESCKKNILSKFDSDEFLFLKDFLSIEKDYKYLDELKNSSKDPLVYKFILSNQMKKSDKAVVISVLKEINQLTNYEFKTFFGEVAADLSVMTEDKDILELLAIIAGKAERKDIQNIIYKKIGEIYLKGGENDKFQRYYQYSGGEAVSENSDGDNNFNETVSSSNKFNIFKDEVDVQKEADSSHSMEFEFTPFDVSKLDSVEEDEITIDLTENTQFDDKVDTIEVAKDVSAGSVDDEEMFEIDLTEEDLFTFNDKIGEEKNKSSKSETLIADEMIISEEYVISADDTLILDENVGDIEDIDINLDNYDDVEITTDKINIDFSDEIQRIKGYIATGNYTEANNKIEELLLLEPDNEELKNLASDIIMRESDLSAVSEKNSTTINKDVSSVIKDIYSDLKAVSEGIKLSIDKVVSPDDYETHYDLALAYMEMELIEDAVEELKRSAIGAKRFDSLVLIAECYKRMGMFDESVQILKLIIIDYGDKADTIVNALFEIGLNLELKGEMSSAQTYFQKVFNLNKDFRNVKSKIDKSNIEAKKIVQDIQDIDLDVSDPTGKEKKGKKKISFL